MSYTPIGWKNYPDKTTPVSAENLNHMEEGIVNNDAAINEIAGTLEEQSENITKVSNSLNGLSFEKCTQAVYDAMSSHDASTLYVIIPEESAATE